MSNTLPIRQTDCPVDPVQALLTQLLAEVKAMRRDMAGASDPARPAGETLLNVKEVAELLHVAVPTVWRLTASGRLPQPRKIGRSSRWDRRELLAHVQK